MKNFLFLILLLLFLSCEKKSGCYSCTTKFDVIHSDSTEIVTWSVSDTKDFCDKTEDQITQYEIDNTKTTSFVSGGVTTTTKSVTTCLPK